MNSIVDGKDDQSGVIAPGTFLVVKSRSTSIYIGYSCYHKPR